MLNLECRIWNVRSGPGVGEGVVIESWIPATTSIQLRASSFLSPGLRVAAALGQPLLLLGALQGFLLRA